jgi:NADPH2:quinone reductase
VWLKEFGGPEALVPRDAPDPVIGEGQALVEVAFAGVRRNPDAWRFGADYR